MESSSENKSKRSIEELAASSVHEPPPAKKQATEKSRGLRHLSMMVCKKIEAKGTVTYNQVADELVQEIAREKLRLDPDAKPDEKNIRRRVYDALNVLMAMDIITKDKSKDRKMTWRGLPSSAQQDLEMLERERDYRKMELERKRGVLKELLAQQVCFHNIVEHNAKNPPPAEEAKDRIPLPFVVINTNASAYVNCTMNPDLTEVTFDFSTPFELRNEVEILKRLGMHKTDLSTIQTMIPTELLDYCKEHKLLDGVLQTK